MTTSSIRTRAPRSAAATKAYPVKECAGLLFAYMGPQPVPELPVWEPFTWENGFREVVLSDIPCNWFQCQENSCDPGAFRMDARQLGAAAQRQKRPLCRQAPQAQVRGVRLRLHLQARARGPATRAIRYWTVGRVALWPNGFYLGNHFEWRVPIDDENTLSVALVLHARAEGARALRAGEGPDLGEPDQGRERPLDHQPRHQPGHHRLGRARARSPTAPRRTSARATSASR